MLTCLRFAVNSHHGPVSWECQNSDQSHFFYESCSKNGSQELLMVGLGLSASLCCLDPDSLLVLIV